jgi:hypothetical protein
MVYFHKFFSAQSSIISLYDPFEKLILAATLIFLATKSCNKFVSIENLVVILHKKFPLVSLNLIKENIISLEFEILCTIGFDLNFDLPYEYLFKFRGLFNDSEQPKLYFTYCQWFLNDSFFLPLCIYHEPRLIALSAIYLLSQNFKVDVFDRALLNMEEIESVKKIVKYLSLIYSCKNQGKGGGEKNTINEKNEKLDKLPKTNCVMA